MITLDTFSIIVLTCHFESVCFTVCLLNPKLRVEGVGNVPSYQQRVSNGYFSLKAGMSVEFTYLCTIVISSSTAFPFRRMSILTRSAVWYPASSQSKLKMERRKKPLPFTTSNSLCFQPFKYNIFIITFETELQNVCLKTKHCHGNTSNKDAGHHSTPYSIISYTVSQLSSSGPPPSPLKYSISFTRVHQRTLNIANIQKGNNLSMAEIPQRQPEPSACPQAHKQIQ